VWRAYDKNLGKWVALKLFEKGEPLYFATREAYALSALEGPCILKVINADRFQDVPYLTTEIIAGGTAQDRVGRYGLQTGLAVRWTRHMLVGLGVCHTRGLLHRDIKPSNIFLRSDEEALLGDFGVVDRLTSDGTTDAGGTPEIRAPECWATGRATVLSDVYSAGLGLYVMLTGRFPFVGTTESEVKDAVLARRHPRLRDVAPHVSRRIAMRVERAMGADPRVRYQTAAEFHEALGDVDADKLSWSRLETPHPGHEMCWISGGESPQLTVCVDRRAAAYRVETRHARGRGSRILSRCGRAANEAALAVLLRRAFK
jgi:serine/threonine protein kinase